MPQSSQKKRRHLSGPQQNSKGSSATSKSCTAEQIFQQILANKKQQQLSHNLDSLPVQTKKNVCILSTLHTSVMVNTTTKKKPETVTFYNKTKCGVDIADQMTRQYTVKAGIRRWPVAQYFGPCLYQRLCVVHVQEENWRSISRRNVMFQLATELKEAHVQGKADPPATFCLPYSTTLIKIRWLTKAESESNAKLM